MWQTKYASAVPKNLGVRVNFWPCIKKYFLSGPCMYSLIDSTMCKDKIPQSIALSKTGLNHMHNE